MTLAGFPHSGISGSRPTCGSPKLFAAYHALLRLSVPRHPPCALLSLDRICSLARSPRGLDEAHTGPPESLTHTGALESISLFPGTTRPVAGASASHARLLSQFLDPNCQK